MKIGILTFHRAINYGAFLQAYGLCQRLNEESDIEAEIIDFRMTKEHRFYSHRNYRYISAIGHLMWVIRHFRKYCYQRNLLKSFSRGYERLPISEESLISDNIDDFQNFVRGKYDIIIAGSDEIWKVNGLRGFPTPYWLPGELGCKKFSYAASARNDFSKLDDETKTRINEYLNGFQYISVRDELTRRNILEYTPPIAEVEIHPDPSFIYDYNASGENGRKILTERAGFDSDKKIALVMMDNEEIANQIYKELSADYQLVALFSPKKIMKSISNLDPFEWLDVIAGADLVCASYFHAICFSIVYQTPFIAFAADGKETKLTAILESSGNINRLIRENSEMYRNGFIREKSIELSSKPDGSIYVEKSRLRFEDYISVLRQCASDVID